MARKKLPKASAELEAIHDIAKRNAECHNLLTIFKVAKARAKWILEQDRADKWRPQYGNREACVADAQRIRQQVSEAARLLSLGMAEQAAVAAYWLGRYAERLGVRPAEPLAEQGKKMPGGNPAGPKARSEKAKERRKAFRDNAEVAVNAARQQKIDEGIRHPSNTAVIELAASKLKISPRQVYRRLEMT